MTSAKKILVTGGAGFIGSYLVKYWLKTDPAVSIVNFDKLTYCGDLSRLKEVEANPRYHFIKGDVCDPAAVEAALGGCEAVVHLAAETHVDRSLLEAKTFFDTNFYGTYVLLEAALRRGIKKFLLVSTDEVYGSRPSGYFTEKDRLSPTSPYSVSKAAADLLVLSYAETRGMHAAVTRGSNTFGPYQYPEKVIPLFVSNALSDEKLPLYGDGRQVRNWIHAEDHCRGILFAFNKGKSGEIYNISTPFNLENIELTRRILKILGKPPSLIKKVKDRLGHDRRYAISSAKLRRLGWKERMPFEMSLRETVLWYRENQGWWKGIKEKNRDFKEYYAKAYAGRT
jgi:dTDP-glucose 4,6-dehydratase